MICLLCNFDDQMFQAAHDTDSELLKENARSRSANSGIKKMCYRKTAIPWLPMGLNSPKVSEFHFSYFMSLRCPGILRDLIA